MSNYDSSSLSRTPSSSSLSQYNNPDYKLFVDSLQQFSNSNRTLMDKIHLNQQRLENEFIQMEENLNAVRRQWDECNSLIAMKEDLESSLSQNSALVERLQQAELDLHHYKSALNQWRHTKILSSSSAPSTASKSAFRFAPSHYLQLFLGNMNVTIYRTKDRILYKDNYNEFKQKSTLLFILFPLIQLLFFQPGTTTLPFSKVILSSSNWSYWFFQIHSCWLVYYYCSSSLRENILYWNGSSMKSWWIIHHYISIGMTLMMMSLSEQIIAEKLRWFDWFGLVQGAIMLFQNMYQKKRNYVRRTLGKAVLTDVYSTETLAEKPTDLIWLVPMLYGLYITEFWFGYEFIRMVFEISHAQLGCFCIGVGFCILAIGNVFTTTQVIVSKSKSRRRANISSIKMSTKKST
jgi:hypothetical protein